MKMVKYAMGPGDRVTVIGLMNANGWTLVKERTTPHARLPVELAQSALLAAALPGNRKKHPGYTLYELTFTKEGNEEEKSS